MYQVACQQECLTWSLLRSGSLTLYVKHKGYFYDVLNECSCLSVLDLFFARSSFVSQKSLLLVFVSLFEVVAKIQMCPMLNQELYDYGNI